MLHNHAVLGLWWIAGPLFVVSICYGVEDFCTKDVCGSVKLDFVLDSDVSSDDPNKLFFIETSGRDYLTTRQACAVESVVQNGGVRAIVVMASDDLNLSANNATYQLYHRFKG